LLTRNGFTNVEGAALANKSVFRELLGFGGIGRVRRVGIKAGTHHQLLDQACGKREIRRTPSTMRGRNDYESGFGRVGRGG